MIQKIFIENFKAINKAANLPLQFFTVFIGNNGTGKSSVMEALRMLQLAINTNLTEAFKEWGGLERVINYNANSEPITIVVEALVNNKTFEYQVHFNLVMEDKHIYYTVDHEELICDGRPVLIAKAISARKRSEAYFYDNAKNTQFQITDDPSRIWLGSSTTVPLIPNEVVEFSNYVKNWQFLYLNAHQLGQPILRSRNFGSPKLNYTGANIAEYLLWMRDDSPENFNNLIRKMQFVLPYIKDIQSTVTEAFGSEIELSLHETSEKSKPLPGWLLSSGTLRILALLAMFETPDKPSVLFIDEVENGLDPRTIGLLLSQIENSFAEKSMQVVATTHSPYFLDLVPLESIIVAEKAEKGSTYHIPSDESSLNLWREKFSPGKLYTMGKLTK